MIRIYTINLKIILTLHSSIILTKPFVSFLLIIIIKYLFRKRKLKNVLGILPTITHSKQRRLGNMRWSYDPRFSWKSTRQKPSSWFISLWSWNVTWWWQNKESSCQWVLDISKLWVILFTNVIKLCYNVFNQS